MKTDNLSLIEMAKLLNIKHTGFLFQASKIYDAAIKAGYEYNDLVFKKVNPLTGDK